MSEIYPIDDLAWENNSVGNGVRAAILRLSELSGAECVELLDTLNEIGLPDQRPVAEVIGLAPDAGSLWSDLRVGELKLLLALAGRDEEAIREGCQWVRHFEQLDTDRRRVYRCIETLVELDGAAAHREALRHLYGSATVGRAEALLDNRQRFFGLVAPGAELKGCDMHRRLLAAYGKLRC
jgi:ribosomal protein S12 methylthiotransferase accessory factor